MKRLCKILIAVHSFLAAVFDIFFIMYTDKLETLHDDNDLCITKIWEVQNKIHLKPSSNADTTFWTVYHAHANGFSRDDVDCHIYVIFLFCCKNFFTAKQYKIEKENGSVCTKLSFRLMQISLNVDVYGCQERLNHR